MIGTFNGEARYEAGEAPVAGTFSTAIEHAELQAAMQPWVEMECFQMSAGPAVARIDHLNLGSQQIVRETQLAGVQKVAFMPPELCTISCCRLAPHHGYRFNNLGGAGFSDALFFLPGNNECDVFVPGGAQTDYILFNREEFLHDARALDPGRWESAPSHLTFLPNTHQAQLGEIVDHWLKFTESFASLEQRPEEGLMRRLLLQQILNAISIAGPGQPPVLDRAYAVQTCRKARTFVEGKLSNDILPTIPEICRAVGVSERSLQYAFKAYVEMSPLAYLRMCRLSRARAQLAQPREANTSVTKVAIRLGFFHLGKFARDYARHFGESPSATLKKGLARG